MSAAAIIVVGLGPGRWDDLTVAARAALEDASGVICRTTRHPTVDELRERRPELAIDSFDALYDGAQSFDALFATIVDRLIALVTSPAGGAECTPSAAPRTRGTPVPGPRRFGDGPLRGSSPPAPER